MTEPPTNETLDDEKSGNRFGVGSEMHEYSVRGSRASNIPNQMKLESSKVSLVKPTESQIEESMMRSQMYSEDALRATSAGAALSKAGQILRGTGNQYMDGKVVDHFKKSFKVEAIDYFWSHSWRANAGHKVCTLLFFHNGSKALSAGMIAALLVSITAWPNRWVYDTPVTTQLFAVIFGQMAFWVILLCWRSSTTVFLDKICIHQTDAKLKEAGIKSLGGFLRHSSQMLILFDDTYLSRLWCVFEVATLLNLRDVAASIEIEPVRSGLITLGLVATTNITLAIQFAWYVASYNVETDSTAFLYYFGVILFQLLTLLYAVPIWRFFVRETSNAKKQISEFSFDSSRCFCCDNNHIFPGTGTPIPCDRDSVRQCIHAWFGTTENFEDFARYSLAQQFSMAGFLTYKQSFAASIGRAYLFIGSMSYWHSGSCGLEGSVAWQKTWGQFCFIFSFPICFNIFGRIVWLFNSAPQQGWKGWTVNCVCILLAGIVIIIEEFLDYIVVNGILVGGIGASPVSAYMIYFSLLIVTSVLIFPEIRKPCQKALGRNKGQPQTHSASDQQPTSESEPKKAVEGKQAQAEAELDMDAQLAVGSKIDLFV